MAIAPRSQRLIGFGTSTSGNSPPWSSPAGYITLVKSAIFANYGSAAVTATIVVSGVGVSEPLELSFNVAANSQVQWNGWFVLNPLDSLYVNVATTSPFTAWVSGAVLAGAPQFPSA